MAIKGMTVTLRVKTEGEPDPFGVPTYTEKDEDVENVIVSPASTTDITNSVNLWGKKAVYTLGIPKGDTHDWTDTTVVFFGEVWRTFGAVIEGIEANIPLTWHKKVMVERYE